MKVIKRNGIEVNYDISKINVAITKANNETNELTNDEVNEITSLVDKECNKFKRALNVEEIQDVVETILMKRKAYKTAKTYITYRYQRALARKGNTTDARILSLINCENEEVKQENSNKNPTILSVQRDYVAGEVSKDLSKRYLVPEHIMRLHEDGSIHIHDLDYYMQAMHNCDLINLEDMLENGTVISGTKIERPHSFSTACNIATQIIAQVASSQFGGQSINLAHLAPFVDISRKKIKKEVEDEFRENSFELIEEKIGRITNKRLLQEIKRGVQTIQYQIITLMTTNGQAPFITIFMYLKDAKSEQEKEDLALIIKEMLNQRIKGVQNKDGVWITPAFPKLIYVLEDDNVKKNSKYYYLTELAAKCSAKRMVPDYISEKKMLELKGHVFSSMGCVEGDSVVDYKIDGKRYVESFKRAWERLSKLYTVEFQDNGWDNFIRTPNVLIYDNNRRSYVEQKCIIRNTQDKWYKVKFEGGRIIHVTDNHPFETENRGVVLARDLTLKDIILKSTAREKDYSNLVFNENAWLDGVLLFSSIVQENATVVSIDANAKEAVEKIEKKLKQKKIKFITKFKNKTILGKFYDIRIDSENFTKNKIALFESAKKDERVVPSYIWNSSLDTKMSFIAGIVDSFGKMSEQTMNKVSLASNSRELVQSLLTLLLECGINAEVVEVKTKDMNKLKLEFYANSTIKDLLVFKFKKALIDADFEGVEAKSLSRVVSIVPYEEKQYSYDVTTESEHFAVNSIYSHNCRSFLSEWSGDKNKFWGRFNKGVTTINLVDVACSALGKNYNKDLDSFFRILDDRLEICHESLLIRYKKLLGTKSNVAPILWQYGAISRLKEDETIDSLLTGGYSTISLGYAGLWETVYELIGAKLTEERGKELGLKILKYMNEKCDKWNEELNLGYGIYGTPLESTTYKFAKCLQNKFGIIEGVTDKNYVTNSYHVHVTEPIDAFSKLKLESEFQSLSTGGAISYIEVPNMQNNIPAVLSVLEFIYENIMYAEINTKSDYCQECGFSGEIEIKNIDGKMRWCCPNCKNTNHDKMNTARRICGYIGTNDSNQGRLSEIAERVLHL